MYPPSGACSFALNAKAQCIDAVLADSNRALFLVGTNALHSNQLCLLEYDTESCVVKSSQIAPQDCPILGLAMHPKNPQLFLTIAKESTKTSYAELFKMDYASDDSDTSKPLPITSIVKISDEAVAVSKAVWQPNETNPKLATVLGSKIFFKTLGDGYILSDIAQCNLEIDVFKNPIERLAWDPHSPNILAYTSGTSIDVIDIRSSQNPVTLCQQTHLSTLYDLDYNPNKPHILATGGDDGKLKFWDLRYPNHALLSFAAHSHWITCIRYNRFHDQLVASSSTDKTVALYRISSISSSPLIELDEKDLMNDVAAGNHVSDTKVRQFGEHLDSVYSIAWGVCDAWHYASLSYDGIVHFQTVPSTEKYKILL